MNIGQRIKIARIAKRMTQEELGNLLGVQGSAVAKYEKGRVVNLKQATLIKISQILDIPLSDLITINQSDENCDNSRNVFAHNLKYFLKASGCTQKEVADAIGVSTASFCDWINGKKYPRIEKIEELARFFGLSKSCLIDEDKESEDNELDARKAFSKNLRLLMAERDVSRKNVSEGIGVSYYTFTDWYNGIKYPRIDNLEKLAQFFNISVPELIGKTTDTYIENTHQQISKDDVLEIILRLYSDEKFLKIVKEMKDLDSEKLVLLQQLIDALVSK